MIKFEEHRNSAAWTVLKKHYEARLETLRRQNDGDLDDSQTRRLRGRIAEVKAFLALGAEQPQIEDEPYIE